MSGQGFDTWILELRGAGLSTEGVRSAEVKKPVNATSEPIDSAIEQEKNGAYSIEQSLNINSYASAEIEVPPAKGLLEAGQNSAISGQMRDLSQRLINIIDEGQRSVSPQFIGLQDRFFTTIEVFQKQFELVVKYKCDFDHYLEEDVPAAVRWST